MNASLTFGQHLAVWRWTLLICNNMDRQLLQQIILRPGVACGCNFWQESLSGNIYCSSCLAIDQLLAGEILILILIAFEDLKALKWWAWPQGLWYLSARGNTGKLGWWGISESIICSPTVSILKGTLHNYLKCCGSPGLEHIRSVKHSKFIGMWTHKEGKS